MPRLDNSLGPTQPPNPLTLSLEAMKSSERKSQKKVISTKYIKKISPSKKITPSDQKKTQDLKKIFERIQEKKERRKLIDKETYKEERKKKEKKINCNKKIIEDDIDTDERVKKKVEIFERKLHSKSVENSNVKFKKKLGQQTKILSQSPNSPILKKKSKKQNAKKIGENLKRVENLTPKMTKNLSRKLKDGDNTLVQKSIWDFWKDLEKQRNEGTQN